MLSRGWTTWLAAVLLFLSVRAAAQGADSFTVESPDGANAVTLAIAPQPGSSALQCSIRRRGKELVALPTLGLRLAEHGLITDNLEIAGTETGTLDETFSFPWGKRRTVRNHCHWLRAEFKSDRIRWKIELRAYDDGIAFRFRFPQQPQLSEVVIASEASGIKLADNPAMHFMTCKDVPTSHENEYQRAALGELPKNKLIDLPLLAVWPGGTAAAITEARLRNSGGMVLRRQAEETTLHCRLSPLPAQADICAVADTPFATPWRVVLLADQAGKLIESNLLLCLNDPPAKQDFAWARPGKSTWHWWNGTAEQGLGFPCGMNFQTHKHYIDFCARHDIEYHAVVADERPWHVQSKSGYSPGSDTDILTPRPELELPRILDYAQANGVGIRLWVHWKALDPRLEEAFAQYEAWGVQGLMVDFLNRDDQQMVNFCERVLESAARHHLHIQFHGSYKPSGEQRTYPNLFNREGVLNLEYMKWSKNCTPSHNVGVAYTRLLAGPLDYHLGGFHSARSDDFQPRNENPHVLGTRCHHLAMYVVYENPMPMVSDSPTAYEGQTGFDFISVVPTTWNDTRFVAGDAGEYVVVARRKGDDWYLGGMTNDTPRDVEVPLDFLESGTYDLTLYTDGAEAEDNPNAIARQTLEATRSAPISVHLASGGGFAAVLRPR